MAVPAAVNCADSGMLSSGGSDFVVHARDATALSVSRSCIRCIWNSVKLKGCIL